MILFCLNIWVTLKHYKEIGVDEILRIGFRLQLLKLIKITYYLEEFSVFDVQLYWLCLNKAKTMELCLDFSRMLISLAFDGHVRNIANLNYSLYITFSISILLEFPADLLAIWWHFYQPISLKTVLSPIKCYDNCPKASSFNVQITFLHWSSFLK